MKHKINPFQIHIEQHTKNKLNQNFKNYEHCYSIFCKVIVDNE